MSRDFEIQIASNGTEGLYRYLTNPDIKVVFLDLMMPKIDGLGLLSILEVLFEDKILSGQPKIIIQSAHSDYKMLEKLVNYKCVFSVRRKPLDRDQILADIDRIMSNCQ